MVTVAVARDFNRYPGGRYPRHGKGNGEDFRKNHLLPLLESDQAVEVVLDDAAAGFPASFLEEAFGGLVREGLSLEKIRHLLTITAESEDSEVYRDEAWQYIAEAADREISH
ncbi:STAS-like domain-containing protein [Nioella sp. MMSF_3534]|uniref:STAS-like domain-containing protein n=1 Tax=Nioella sp. MMSF_3534 TaxID=3046720 RepID=UPI00273D34E1|nr:STAS-like domain-containing protein [Nioella sp. MMSF_3534]